MKSPERTPGSAAKPSLETYRWDVRGVILPNITDGFASSAPDLGALDFDQPPPHYGPRPMAQ